MKYLMSTIAIASALFSVQASAQNVADLNDLEFAHAAYTADNIDIRYAHLALALSSNPDIHTFANTMISDHTAVNEAAIGLLEKLGATAQDNFFSQALNEGSETVIDDLSKLRGAEFDAAYAANELAYHQTVNDLVEKHHDPKHRQR